MIPRIEITKRLVLINSASSLITRILSASVLVWLQQYLLKHVTSDEYSLLPLLYSIMMFAPLITTVLTGGLGRFITVAYARGDDDEVTSICSTMFPILCVAAFLFLVTGLTFAWQIDRILRISPERVGEARIMLAMLMIVAAARLPLSPFGLGLYVRQRLMLQNLIGVATELFRFAVLFSLLFGVSTRVIWVVTSSVTADLLSLTVTQVVSRRLVPSLHIQRGSCRWTLAKNITSFGGWSLFMSLGETIRTSADPIVLNQLATTHDVACYHIGSLVQRHFHLLLAGVLAPATPALTAIYAASDMPRLRAIYLRVGRVAMLGGMLVVLPMIVFRTPLIELYAGSQYASASLVLAFLLGQSVFYWGNILFGPICIAAGRIRVLSAATSTMNFLNIALTLVFVGCFQMGSIGSALATFITGTLLQLALVPMALTLLRIPLWRYLLNVWIPGAIPSLLTLPAGVLLQHIWYPATWTALAVEASLISMFYILITLFCISAIDRRDLRELFARIVSSFQNLANNVGLSISR